MLFNSYSFLIFFPMVVAGYYALSPRHRWVLLLAASYYFYMCWKPEYIVLVFLSTLIDYGAALAMGRFETRKARRPYLLLSLTSNLGLLFTFKYFNFFSNSVNALFESFNIFAHAPTFDLLLPVGISFYTFQTLSYSIDVYRGRQAPERHFGIFALYVSFFPQLVAGPIERSERLLPQFRQEHVYDYRRVVSGLQLMLWGLFKKVVIADRLAVYVNAVYNQPGEHFGLHVLIASYFFAFQIYCDFSGYSDMAIGAARVMGYDLMINFRQPYFAKSIREFWARWHISLSTWFRDYLYIPLGGNRVSRERWFFNLFAVFAISGLWHGANWTFIIWGSLHGLYLIGGVLADEVRDRLAFHSEIPANMRAAGFVLPPWFRKGFQIALTFHLVLLGWVFFRAGSVSDAFVLLRNLFLFSADGLQVSLPNFGATELVISLAALGLMEGVHVIERRKTLESFFSGRPRWMRWMFYTGLVAIVLVLGKSEAQDFIYFQF